MKHCTLGLPPLKWPTQEMSPGLLTPALQEAPQEGGLVNLGTGKGQELCSKAGVPSRAQGPKAVEKAPRFFPMQGEAPEEATPATDAPGEPDPDRVYLDLTPIKSFLHGDSGARAPSPTPPHQDPPAETLPLPEDSDPAPDEPLIKSPENPELQVQGLPQ